MNTCLSVPGTAVPVQKKSVFNKKNMIKAAKAILPVAALAMFAPDAMATSNDLMASGDATVKGTFGKDSKAIKWVILAEVLVGAIMYMTTKNIKFLAGFAILSVFVTVGMSVAGY